MSYIIAAIKDGHVILYERALEKVSGRFRYDLRVGKNALRNPGFEYALYSDVIVDFDPFWKALREVVEEEKRKTVGG